MNFNTLFLLITLAGLAGSETVINGDNRKNSSEEASIQLYPDPPVCPICVVDDE